MDFKELGNIFKAEREHRGLSIKEVMEVTKISRRNLLAIEDGNTKDLPHPVYAKGFVRSYARFLGLDGEELARVFDAELIGEQEPLDATDYDVNPGTDLAFQEADRRASSGKNGILSVVLIIALLVILGGLVYYFGFYKSVPPEQAQVTPSVEIVEGSSTVDESKVEHVQENSVEGETKTLDEPEAAAAAPGSSPSTASASITAKQKELQPETEETAVPDENSEDINFAHVLLIRATAKQGCWVGVWKNDDAMARDFFLRNGEPLRLKFNSYRRVRIGNVPGVSVQYNGKAYPLDAQKGKTQDLRFGKN